jgi:hypothetical protein
MAKNTILGVVIALAAAGVAVRSLWPSYPAQGEARPTMLPLSPAAWTSSGATHVGLIQTPGRLWITAPDRDGRLAHAVEISEIAYRFPRSERVYGKVARLRFVTPHDDARWYHMQIDDRDIAVAAEVVYTAESAERFTVTVGDATLPATGDPTFPATVTRGAIASVVTPALAAELDRWCDVGVDLVRVSRHHPTYVTGLSTRVGNAVAALCCLAGRAGCEK